jgi:uncharacterized membrane protein
MMGPRDRRTEGNAVTVVLLVLLVVGAALGVNYVRNYQIDEKDEKNNRPYAHYEAAVLEILAEGYRMELAAAEKRYGGSRVQTRQRHHFSDQIQEFERVQSEARKARDKALDVAQIRQDLQAIEAEQQRRATGDDGVAIHIKRMFRI